MYQDNTVMTNQEKHGYFCLYLIVFTPRNVAIVIDEAYEWLLSVGKGQRGNPGAV